MISQQTIDNMISQGAPPEQIDHAKNTMNSPDANDVVHHRNYIKTYNSNDQWRHVNNWIMHAGSYQYGATGSSSVNGIAHQLGQLRSTV